MKLSKEALMLIKGENTYIFDDSTFFKVRNELRQIKENCNIVLSQMKGKYNNK